MEFFTEILKYLWLLKSFIKKIRQIMYVMDFLVLPGANFDSPTYLTVPLRWPATITLSPYSISPRSVMDGVLPFNPEIYKN